MRPLSPFCPPPKHWLFSQTPGFPGGPGMEGPGLPGLPGAPSLPLKYSWCNIMSSSTVQHNRK